MIDYNYVAQRRSETYPRGTRVRLLGLARDGGPQETLPVGTEGTVESVDSMGTVHVHWDNGSRLGALAEDRITRI